MRPARSSVAAMLETMTSSLAPRGFEVLQELVSSLLVLIPLVAIGAAHRLAFGSCTRSWVCMWVNAPADLQRIKQMCGDHGGCKHSLRRSKIRVRRHRLLAAHCGHRTLPPNVETALKPCMGGVPCVELFPDIRPVHRRHSCLDPFAFACHTERPCAPSLRSCAPSLPTPFLPDPCQLPCRCLWFGFGIPHRVDFSSISLVFVGWIRHFVDFYRT